MSLRSGSNNIYYDMPPMMSDGRNYAEWQPEAVVNNKIRQAEGIKSNWEYRQFLQNNATNIMKHNFYDAGNASGNIPVSNSNSIPSNNSPFVFNSTHDKRKPNYGYNNSDLKQSYLSREQLNARMIAPSISTNY